jgi:hypothetical protein
VIDDSISVSAKVLQSEFHEENPLSATLFNLVAVGIYSMLDQQDGSSAMDDMANDHHKIGRGSSKDSPNKQCGHE